MLPEKSVGVGWDSLKFSFHSLLLLIMLSHQAFVLVLSRIIQIFDRAIVISDNMDLTHLRRPRRKRRLVKIVFLFYFEISHMLRSIQCVSRY